MFLSLSGVATFFLQYFYFYFILLMAFQLCVCVFNTQLKMHIEIDVWELMLAVSPLILVFMPLMGPTKPDWLISSVMLFSR